MRLTKKMLQEQLDAALRCAEQYRTDLLEVERRRSTDKQAILNLDRTCKELADVSGTLREQMRAVEVDRGTARNTAIVAREAADRATKEALASKKALEDGTTAWGKQVADLRISLGRAERNADRAERTARHLLEALDAQIRGGV